MLSHCRDASRSLTPGCTAGDRSWASSPTLTRIFAYGGNIHNTQPMADVFLSYTMRDVKIAKQLTIALREHGISVFWAHDSMQAGESIHETLTRALADARAFVMLHPGEVGSSEFLKMETEAALSRGKSGGLLVIPVLLPGREPVGDIGNFRYVRVDSSENLAPLVQIVATALAIRPKEPESMSALYLRFLSNLLRTDLAQAPQAASLVLDEISSTATAQADELQILTAALAWGTQQFGQNHPSVRSSRYQLSRLLAAAGRYQESAALGSQVLETSDDPSDRLAAGINLGNSYAAEGDLDLADRHYLQVLTLAREIGSGSGQSAALVALGSTAQRRGHLTIAQSRFEDALGLTTQFGDPSARISALVGLSNVQRSLGDPLSAMASATQALHLAQRTLDHEDPLIVQAATALRAAEDEQ